MQLRIFNTLSRSVEPFEPLNAGEVKLYCCGPTVYSTPHLGNLRTYIFEDVLVRVLRYFGLNVSHVMNITDVGHMVSDADEGEDKMLVAARREGKKSADIAAFYSKMFFEHCKALNITSPSVVCSATAHVQEMIELIEKLMSNGCAYQAAGNIYFDVTKYKDYGKMALLKLDQLEAGARIEVDSNKRNPHDFALWFTNSKFENQELQWDSPWGRGYPGWHIECSAMAMKYLGEQLDIHCGGIDHIPVHHTNEIAQSEGATGKQFARYWMHGAFLVMGKTGEESERMGKSKGNILSVDTLIEKGYDPIAYRLFCFSAGYRQELAWSWQALDGASSTLKKLKQTVIQLRESCEGAAESTTAGDDLRREFEEAISDDLAMPRALRVLHSVLNSDNLTPAEKLKLVDSFDDILGLGTKSWVASKEDIPEDVLAIADERLQARREKNWAKSDELRNKLLQLGFTVEDQKESYKLKRNQ